MNNFKNRNVFKAMGVHKLRRNDVVIKKNGDANGHAFYGRVLGRIDFDHVEVIDTGKYVNIYADEDLELSDYRGYLDDGYSSLRIKYPVYRRMPSLRKLKQARSYYDKRIWKKNRITPRYIL